jgi:hypothetical protein
MPVNLAFLISDVRSRLDEVTPRFWQDTELTNWINEGLRDISRRTETIQSFWQAINTSPNIAKYPLPPDVIRIHRLEFVPAGTNVTYPIQASTYQEMDQVWGINQQSQTMSYPYNYVLWGFPPNLMMQLYPVPAQSGTLNLFYYRLPALLINPTDIAEIPEGWHDLIAIYCEVVARRKDKDDQWKDTKQIYDERLNQMYENTRQWHDQARAMTIGYNAVPEWLYGGLDF